MNARVEGDRVARPPRRGRLLLEIVLVVILAFLLVGFAGFAIHSFRKESVLVRVGDDQVAVILDRWSGEARATSLPGVLVHVPWLQEVSLLSRSPRTLVMGGMTARGQASSDSGAAADRAPRLLARASDGSSFWLDEVAVQYAIRPELAAAVLDDQGSGDDASRELLGAHVRSILRDELGRVSSEEIARGERIGDAVRAATSRLEAALAPHGIAILGISTGKAGFDTAYEDTIDRAKSFRQQGEELAERASRLEQDRGSREGSVAKAKEVELAKLEGDLVRDRGAAVRDDLRVRQETDDFVREQRLAGEAAKVEMAARAALVKARNVAAARAVLRDALDLESAGEFPVREALVEKLSKIEIDLVPSPREAERKSSGGESPTKSSAARP